MTLAQLAGELARLGLSVGTAFALFEWVGKRWAEQRFARQLEEYKRRQQELLAEYTMKVNGAFQRLSNLQERELAVLSELWVRLCDTKQKVHITISAYRDVTDISDMPLDALEEFLSHHSFSPLQRHELQGLGPAERQDRYMTWLYRRQAADAWNCVSSLQEYVERNKLFLEPDLYDTVKSLGFELWSALDEHKDRRAAETDPPPPRGEEPSDFQFFMMVKETIDAAMTKIEAHVRTRLYYYEAK